MSFLSLVEMLIGLCRLPPKKNSQSQDARKPNEDKSLEEGIAEDEAAADLEEGISDDDKAGDVYMLDEDISHGIWEVGYMPNEGDYIHNNEDGQEITEGGELVERHTVSMLVQDIPGVL